MGRCDDAFAPVVGNNPRVLVLGSMPGVASLAAQQYYAHPRNAFWAVMAALDARFTTAGGVYVPYAQRLALLRQNHIALWDVIARCERRGSLDSAIVPASVVANDFNAFLRRYPSLRLLVFNGASVEALFRRHALPAIAPALLPPLLRLPSTSPANARLSLAQKIAAWSVLRDYL